MEDIRSHFVILVLMLLASIGCTQKPNSESRVRLVLPEGTQTTARVMSKSTMSATTWGMAIPQNQNEVLCYGLLIEAADLGRRGLTCTRTNGTKLPQAQLVFGLFKAGSEVVVDVPFGDKRRFFLLGFGASSKNECVDHRNGLPHANLSKPMILAEKVVEVSKGEINLELQAKIDASATIEDCEWDQTSSPVSPVPTPSPTPGASPTPVPATPTPIPAIPVVRFSSSASSPSEAVGSHSATVELSTPSTLTVSVPFTVSGTADGSDHSLLSGTLTFSPGETSKPISFNVIDDSIDELDETVVITLGAPTNATLHANDFVHTATIVDNDSTFVIGVTSSYNNAAYPAGSTLDIQVQFSGSVDVAGSPYLLMETGAVDRQATYISGTGTSTLTFRYTVMAGDTSSDLDYHSSAALQLNGGTIQAFGANAILTLPTPGAANSLGANKAIVIDTTPPVATLMNLDPLQAHVVGLGSTTLNVTFSESVTGLTSSDFSATNATIGTVSGSGASYAVNVTLSSDGPFTVSLNAATVVDAAGNGNAVVNFKSHHSRWQSFAGSSNARKNHTSIWNGRELLVYGGQNAALATGAYSLDPVSNTWLNLPTTGTPPGDRADHTAVWTGKEMIIWGGTTTVSSGTTSYAGTVNTGSMYDGATWTAVNTTGAPTPRIRHSAVWTGKEMLAWGGMGSGGGNLNTGAKYNPTSNSWTDITTTNAPTARSEHASVWTGKHMLIWGGAGAVANGKLYDPTANSWTEITTTGAPTHWKYVAHAWTGQRWIVWGGFNGTNRTNQGFLYDPSMNTWTSMSTVNAPSSRDSAKAAWTGTHFVVWGGKDGAINFGDGGIYDPRTDTWRPLPNAGSIDARYGHSLTWTGDELIIWGGYAASFRDDGARLKIGPYDGRIRDLAMGFNHTCALSIAGDVKCWGYNGFGELGLGDTTTRGNMFGQMGDNLPPVDLGVGRRAKQIVAGMNFSCALLDDHSVKCWGNGANGRLGNNSTANMGDNANEVAPQNVIFGAGLVKPVQITAGGEHACALMSDATVRCWGSNGYGQIGDGTPTERLTAVAISVGSPVREVRAGMQHTCASHIPVGLSCWGRNDMGQLGDTSTTTARFSPYAPSFWMGAEGVQSLRLGDDFSCATTSTDLYCWGNKANGRVGDGTQTGFTNMPTSILALSAPTRLEVGGTHACLRHGASFECWGDGSTGALGLEDAINRATPTSVSTYFPNASRIWAGSSRTCAEKANGDIVCWGSNLYGELGKGDIVGLGATNGSMSALVTLQVF